ncbi:MAG: hypothetical protein QM368_05620 [Bacillota bacterium]|nr:hypothetical protein [Bacillota bacterium]
MMATKKPTKNLPRSLSPCNSKWARIAVNNGAVAISTLALEANV